ncbi:MAG TPA: NAD(P)/FAD-dependent oxidoreductase [Solirubrobacteraceae bacterium]|jgi:thioredoxin reductase (NADPH)
MTTDLQTDAGEIRDITIIGAGPVGLSTAFWAGMRQASARIIDSLPDIGGQLTTLYPEKWIFDVPGHPRVLAKDLVAQLREQALGQFDVPVWLDTTALALRYEEVDGERIVVLETDRGELRSRTVIVSGGHGAFEPKKLPVSDVDMAPWEGRGAHYLVSEKKDFEGKHVVIVGGGDSAFDWVVNLLGTADRITLVHRRDGFRAHEATVAEVMAAADAGKVDLRIPSVIRRVDGNGTIEAVELHHPNDESVAPERLECDAVLLQLGFSTKLGPLKEWGFELSKGAIVVDPLMRTTLDGVWACGDITTFDGKLKLIATGFAESAIAVAQAVHSFRPDMKIQPAYSTNTGVPAQTPDDVTPSYAEPVGAPGTAEGQV